jgi:hypothetical protein
METVTGFNYISSSRGLLFSRYTRGGEVAFPAVEISQVSPWVINCFLSGGSNSWIGEIVDQLIKRDCGRHRVV